VNAKMSEFCDRGLQGAMSQAMHRNSSMDDLKRFTEHGGSIDACAH